jgi:hypothetical protein
MRITQQVIDYIPATHQLHPLNQHTMELAYRAIKESGVSTISLTNLGSIAISPISTKLTSWYPRPPDVVGESENS